VEHCEGRELQCRDGYEGNPFVEMVAEHRDLEMAGYVLLLE